MLGIGGGLTHSAPIAKDLTDYTSLTGESGFIVPYTNNAPFNDNYTISFWFKTSDGRRGAPVNEILGRTLMSVISNIDASGHFESIALILLVSGKLRLVQVVTIDPIVSTSYTTDDALADGAVDWTHLAFVVTGGNGSDTAIAIYINGVESSGYTIYVNGGGVTSALHDGFTNDNGVWIATGVDTLQGPSVPTPDGSKGIHNGTDFIDDFALHSAALDAAAITAVYNSGTPINLLADSGNYDNSSDVVLYYKFNGKYDGDALLDSHGTQNALQGNGVQFSTESAT